MDILFNIPTKLTKFMQPHYFILIESAESKKDVASSAPCNQDGPPL